jgi:chromosome segregation ATPase
MRPLFLCSLALLTLLSSLGGTAEQARAAIDADVEQLRKDVGTTRSAEIQQNETGAPNSSAARDTANPASPQPNAAASAIASQQDRIARLESDIKAGETASNNLKAQIDSLNAEKQKLLNVQTALTSGLIGALVTAAVAIASALSNFGRSRVDRDYRRLEVLDKAQALAERGLNIPTDIVLTYFREKSTASPFDKPARSKHSPGDGREPSSTGQAPASG